jgi:hypothetical protein
MAIYKKTKARLFFTSSQPVAPKLAIEEQGEDS